MYLSIILLNLVVTSRVFYADADKIREQIAEIVDLRTVTDFAELEDMYRDMHEKYKKAIPWVPYSTKLRIRVRKKLCKKIFNSTFYDMQEEDWLHPNDPDNRQKIENKFPGMYRHVYEQMYDVVRGHWRKYVNDYMEMPILLSDQGSRKEYLFTCFTIERRTGEIALYFVSKEYNVTEDMAGASPIAARFIFGLDEHNKISLIAMAEESATGNTLVDKTSIAEIYYVGFRQQTPMTSEIPEQDIVCKLPPSHKLRLCASVFASKLFRIQKIKFKPLMSNVVEQNCVKRQVSFAADISKRRRLLLRISMKKLKKYIYEEWMFACKVSNADEQELFYYVSSGDRAHSVFLHFRRFSDEKLYVENYIKNVSVVGARLGDSHHTSAFKTPPESDDENVLSTSTDDVGGPSSADDDIAEISSTAEDVGPSLSRSRTTKELIQMFELTTIPE